MSREAAARLQSARDEIARLTSALFELECLAREEAAANERRALVVDWERERILFGHAHTDEKIAAVATWPVSLPAVDRWYIGLGRNGKLLAVYEINRTYKGAVAAREYGDAPHEVVMAMCRTYGVKHANGS